MRCTARGLCAVLFLAPIFLVSASAKSSSSFSRSIALSPVVTPHTVLSITCPGASAHTPTADRVEANTDVPPGQRCPNSISTCVAAH
eukprot:scaffold65_cov353-Prasinococcus_capsulatus_cf.AAC.24